SRYLLIRIARSKHFHVDQSCCRCRLTHPQEVPATFCVCTEANRTNMRSPRVLYLVAVVVITISMSGCKQLHQVFGSRPSANMPAYKPVDVQFVQQNWTADQRAWFYHSAQGTELLPYKWFMALE